MNPKITVASIDKSSGLEAALKKIAKAQVLVGIPAEKASRKGRGNINNAELAFIHSNGSPLNHISPRPFLQPAIAKSKKLISGELKLAAQSIMEKKPGEAKQHLRKAGMLAANAAKRYVLDGNNLAPNAPSTIAQKGSDRPLVDTNQMVRSISYVVEEK